MSKDVKAMALGLAICGLMAAISVALPWAERRAEHPRPPETRPLQYIGDEPPPNS